MHVQLAWKHAEHLPHCLLPALTVVSFGNREKATVSQAHACARVGTSWEQGVAQSQQELCLSLQQPAASA